MGKGKKCKGEKEAKLLSEGAESKRGGGGLATGGTGGPFLTQKEGEENFSQKEWGTSWSLNL